MSSRGKIYDCENLRPAPFEMISAVFDGLDDGVDDVHRRTMLVGARARDLIHSRLGDPRRVTRSTTDVDLAVAVENLADYTAMTERFEARRSTSDVKYLVNDIPVDLIPFGGIEDPEGIAKAKSSGSSLSVIAYQSAFRNADMYILPGGRQVRVVDPWHYTAFKIDAWVDRSAFHQYKDADDLRIVFDWFRQYEEYMDAAWVGDPAPVELHDYDEPLGCLRVFGSDVATAIGKLNRDLINNKWDGASRNKLGERLGTSTILAGSVGSPKDEVRAFTAGFDSQTY